MPKFVDDEGKPIDLTLDKLFEAYPEIKAAFGAKVKERVDDRFKHSPDPEALKALQAERDALAAEKQKLADASKSELEKQIERANKLEAALKAAGEETKRLAGESEAKYRQRIIREKIIAYCADNKIPGAKHVATSAASLFQIGDDEEPYSEDPTSGKRLSVKERLDAWRREPGNEPFNPPLVQGSGQRPGAPAPAPSDGDWRKDPLLRKQLARKELASLPVTGALVSPTQSVDAGMVNTDGSPRGA